MPRRAATALGGILLALTACGSVQTSTSATLTTSSPAPSASVRPTPMATARPARTPPPQPEVTSGSVTVESVERGYRIAVPPGIGSAGSVPLMLVLHGYTMDPYQMAGVTGFDAFAQDPGMLVVYPAGTGTRNQDSGWNAGGCCEPANTNGVDDVGFIAALVDQLEADYPVDPDRVFLVGASNGGEMAYRAACELSDRFAAVVNLIGTLLVPCEPTTPISVLDIHGTADTAIGYEGGGDCQQVECPSVAQTMERWRLADGCADDPTVTTEGVVVTTTFSSCSGGVEVMFIKAIGKGHAWYPSAPNDRAVTLDFLMNHPRSTGPG